MEKGMRTGKKLTAEILSGKWDEALKKLYMDTAAEKTLCKSSGILL